MRGDRVKAAKSSAFSGFPAATAVCTWVRAPEIGRWFRQIASHIANRTALLGGAEAAAGSGLEIRGHIFAGDLRVDAAPALRYPLAPAKVT